MQKKEMAAKKEMKTRSYIRNNFLRMFLILEIMVIGMGILIFYYSKQVVGTEIINLNESILKQTGKRTAWAINNARQIGDDIAYNSKVVDWVAANGNQETEEEKVQFSHVENEINNLIWFNFRHRTVFKIYLFGKEELYYSSDKDTIDLKQVKEKFGIAPGEVNNGQEIMFLGSVRNMDDYGIYRYSFQLLKEIRDLITGEFYGYVLVNISEKTLFDTYADLNFRNKKYALVNGDGIVISSGDKREIGYPYDSRFKGVLGKDSGHQISYFDEKTPLYLYSRIEGTNWYLIERMNLGSVWESLDRIRWFIFIMILAFTSLVLPIAYVALRRISTPVNEIKDKMAMAAQGQLDIRVQTDSKDEFGEIGESFNYMAERIEELLKQVKDIEKKKRLIELDFLQEQINPHFIYNTLTSIRFNIDTGRYEEAQEMLLDFTKILRKTLSRSEEFITFDDELDTIRHYIGLQMARYRDGFEVSYEISEETEDCMVSNFILQPIVENAIFYSISEQKKSQIQIHSYIEEGILYIKVLDNGIGMSEEDIDFALQKEIQMNKVGLKNVHERLKLYYGSQYGVKIISESGVGTEVILRMPAIKNSGNRR